MMGSKNKFLQQIAPTSGESMQGAGISANGRQFITHTTLNVEKTAFINLTLGQKMFIVTLILIIIYRLTVDPLGTIVGVLGILSAIYFFDVVFHLFLIVKSLGSESDIKFEKDEVLLLNDQELPVYTILCPLYKESKVITRFLAAIEKISWPKEKLDVILLLEQDDTETLEEVSRQ